MRITRLSALAAFTGAVASACAALTACFGDNAAPPDHDSGAFESSAPDSPAPEASPSDGPQPESSPEAGTLCTNIDLSNAPFHATITNVVGPPPVMTGGDIVPGDYYRTGVTAYDPSDAAWVSGETPSRSIWRFTATTIHTDTQGWYTYDASPDSAPNVEVVGVADYTTDASTFTAVIVCNSLNPDASGLSSTRQYTATPTTLAIPIGWVGDSGIWTVDTYTKQ